MVSNPDEKRLHMGSIIPHGSFPLKFQFHKRPKCWDTSTLSYYTDLDVVRMKH